MKRRNTSATGVLGLLLLLVAGIAQALPALWQPIATPPGFTPSHRTIRYQAVRIDTNRLRPGGDARLDIVLPDSASTGIMRTLIRTRVERPSSKGHVWVGQVLGDSTSRVTLAVVNSSIVGTITSGGHVYRIQSLTGSTAVVEEIDPRRFAPGAEPISSPSTSMIKSPEAGPPCETDDPTRIDVLVAYNARAEQNAGGTDKIEALIYESWSEANQSYAESDVQQRLQLVYVGKVDHTEGSDVTDDRTRLGNKNDQLFKDLTALRDQYGADLVALVVEYDQNTDCGASYVMVDKSYAFADSAFSVVLRDCMAAPNYKFAHELGHLQGARHEWARDPTDNSPAAYNHAHVQLDPTPSDVPMWRTIMGEGGTCGNCAVIPVWSHPTLEYETDATGVDGGAKPEDNHRLLDETAPIVANFRCSLKEPDNPWMKDTWADSGEEPDPDLAGVPMWKSPYIWVRQEADVARAYIHRHQNPLVGRANYAYVKIHNGEQPQANGKLQIYTAPASTGLDWGTDDWKKVGEQEVTFASAFETRVVEFEWTPDVPGHVCMVARWESVQDPMAYPEVADIEANVRRNNNFIWRNLNILDPQDTQSPTVLAMNNTGSREAEYSLTVEPFVRDGRLAGLGAGSLSVELEPKVFMAWKSRGARAPGFRQVGSALVLEDPHGGRIERIRLAGRADIPVRLTIREGARLPRELAQAEGFDVIQSRGSSRRGKVIGGVSYEFARLGKGRDK